MITEQQVNQFEQKAKDDALKAFNEMLISYQKQVAAFREIKNNVDKQKGILSKWAEEAHYQIDWDIYNARPFGMVGDCVKCTKKNVGLIAYNEHGCNVCESCNDRLEREFEEEYK